MKKLVILLLVIALLPLISSVNIQADYQIISNKILVEVKYDNIEGFEYKLPVRYQTLELKTQDYNIENNILKINEKSSSFKFITDYHLDKTPTKNYFILYNPFNQKADISVYLEESSVLPETNRVISPNPTEITSDGRRVILIWKDFDNQEIVFNYEFISKSQNSTKIIILILILILLLIILRYLFLKKIQKRKQKTQNLYEDEKRIIEYLMNQKDKESWTKQMVKDLKISKVKLSRKLRSLEQKGLVKKVPYGNENRITLVE